MRTHLLSLLALLLPACRPGDTGDPEPEDTSVTHGEVRVGEPCPRLELAGVVELTAEGGDVNLGGAIYGAPWPLVGPPVLENEHCSYHRYDASACGQCPGTLVCGGGGVCVPLPTVLTDLTVVASAGGTSHTVQSDPTYGWLWEQWSDGGEDWALEVGFGQDTFEVPAMAIAAQVEGLAVTTEYDDYHGPGALDASWTPRQDGALVRTEIPINHHAGTGTSTLCEAGAEVGGFHADAEMIDPLAVITGLEFQGVWTMHVAAAHTSVGCVEVRMGTYAYVQPVVGG
ncbi:MAG: hypothetical protein ABIO70_23695 [Pseudomonadota bacterium]